MNRHTNKPLQGDKRLYDRFALVGNFYVGEQNVKYTVVDVSLGGLKIKPAETNTNSNVAGSLSVINSETGLLS